MEGHEKGNYAASREDLLEWLVGGEGELPGMREIFTARQEEQLGDLWRTDFAAGRALAGR